MLTRSFVVAGLFALWPAAAAADPKPQAKPTVTAIDPSRGDVDGGTYVRVTGTHFIADGARNAKIYFGSHEGTIIRFSSDNELIAEAPGGKPNETVDVLVLFDPGGETKLVKAFTFVAKH